MKRWISRGLFAGTALLLWTITCIVLMEFLALVYQLYLERTNPFIAAFRERASAEDTSVAIALKDADPFYPESLGGWETPDLFRTAQPDINLVLDWGPPTLEVPAEERLERRLTFPQLSSDAREVYARLGKEIVIAFGQEGQLIKAYGSDKFFFYGVERFLLRAVLSRTSIVPAVRKHLDTALAVRETRSFQLFWPNAEAPAAILPATIIAAPRERADTEAAYLFVSVHPDEIEQGLEVQRNEASRWEREHFRFKKNYHHDSHPGFMTNSLGFRDAERDLPKPEGVFRILCLGGSTTQEGSSNQSTYPALLEARLNQAFPDQTIEVINAGIPGIATPGHLLRFPEYIALGPDLVIMHLGINDALLKYNTWRVNALPGLLRSARSFFPSLLAPSLETFAAHHREYMGYNIELLGALFQRHGAAVALASMAWPNPNTIPPEAHRYYAYQGQHAWEFPAFSLPVYARYIEFSNALLRKKAEKINALYIPVAERIQGGTDVFTDFCHMTQPGIEAKAACMFEAIVPILENRFITDH